MVKDELGTRMKEFYENIPKTKLMRRCPVIIRIDGRSFHTVCRNFQKPFDEVLIVSMQKTMKKLCENIQGVRLGYCQSDEISLLVCDYDKLTSSAFFDYEVQKICSIIASMTTLYFNQIFCEEATDYLEAWNIDQKYYDALLKAMTIGAMFDARCFNIPKEEVTNYFYWRQLDASRNSVQMVGQSKFSHNQLQNKSCNDIQDMLFNTYEINWNDLPTYQKRGSCCIKTEDGWKIDKDIPIWKNEERKYIDDLVWRGEI